MFDLQFSFLGYNSKVIVNFSNEGKVKVDLWQRNSC